MRVMTHLTAPQVKNYPFAELHNPCWNFNVWFSNRNIRGARQELNFPKVSLPIAGMLEQDDL